MTYDEWIAEYVKSQKDFVRGKCKEAVTAMVKAFPELRPAAGFAHVTWGSDQHWWCVAPDGTIVDPTKSQFEFGMVLEYEELDLNDPKTKARIPIGKCVNCGEETYEHSYGRDVCTKRCSESFIAYLTRE